MKHTLIKTVMTAIVAGTFVACAQEAGASLPDAVGGVSGQDKPDASGLGNAEIKVRIDAKARLTTAFNEFAREVGFDYGVYTQDGRFYSKGQSPVAAHYASPSFVKSCAMAYERAYINALSQFVMDFYGRETSTKLLQYYGDNSSNASESPTAKAKGICDKVVLLADAKLNKALEAEGVAPEKYNVCGVVEKRNLLTDAIITKTMKRALQSSSGCIPVRTFVSIGDDGQYYVGVVVRYDATSKELAKCFKNKTRPAVKKDFGLSLKDALPPKEEILSNFGVRLYFDETGCPALLSFGQYGSSYTGQNPIAADRAEEHALRQAQNLADSGLTMFINSFMDISEGSEMSEIQTEDIVFTDDGNATPESVSAVIDKIRRNVKQQGSDTMRGRSTVFCEVLEHPNGHKVAVVVRRWSFATVDAANRMDATRKSDAEKQVVPSRKSNGAIMKGRTYDF